MSDTCFVFSGSVRDDMADIFTNSRSPFFKSALTLNVGSVPDDDFAPFLMKKFLAGGRQISRELIDKVFEFTERVTGDVQQLCCALWLTSQSGDTLDEGSVQMALQEIFAQESDGFERETGRLTRFQFKMLVALAKFGGANVFSADFLNLAEMPSSATAAQAIKRLVANDLIYQYHKEYKFFNPFLKAWLVGQGF